MIEQTKIYRRYQKGEKSVDRQIAFRLPSAEYEILEQLAKQYSGSNVSNFVRSIYFQWKKDYLNESKSNSEKN
jgi:hypothetical protein